MKNFVTLLGFSLLVLSAGCDRLGLPTEPTQDTHDQLPPVNLGNPPASTAGWHAILNQASWYGPVRLRSEFEVAWNGDTLRFDTLTARIDMNTRMGIRASYGEYPHTSAIIINFADQTHAVWVWNSPDGQASGTMELR